MFTDVIFLLFLARIPYQISSQRPCVPNTYFTLNDHVCFCDYRGRWNESNCKMIIRRQVCQPGQIIWQGCNKCICQPNGQLLCTSVYCYSDLTLSTPSRNRLSDYGPKCTPFRSYYVNCSLCFCPASGLAAQAHCAIDTSCSINSQSTDIFTLTKNKQCIPNVLYLFPCVQCLCSENGFFVLDKCLEICQTQVKHVQRCIPGTLYRKDCVICRCPDNSIQDEKLCINSACNKNSKHAYLHSLRSTPNQCVPRTFTEPKCLYCDCTPDGTINEKSCLELDCSKVSDFKFYIHRTTCSPGELVPICVECFCLNNGLTHINYCTRTCTYQSKLNTLEEILNKSDIDLQLIDKKKVIALRENEHCGPRSLYLHEGRYCLCPDSHDTSFKFCTAVIEHYKTLPSGINKTEYGININFSVKCEPNTLIDFDCNTCFCNKSGQIDPKWCTYDDCEAKRTIQESHKSSIFNATIEHPNGACTPGSISKEKCNFCICPDSGILKERVCTKNDCFDYKEDTDNENFVCEPLAYYEVDCNICYCPRDGLKNIAKCTKNLCEKSFLRSSTCTPGQLFSDKCNMCVCPPSGDKADKVCTNHECGVASLNTFRLSSNLLKNDIHDDSIRSLDLCFPGEEFAVDCDLCVCPELGLKAYATCEPILCDEKFKNRDNTTSLRSVKVLNNMSKFNPAPQIRFRRDIHQEDCFIYNVSNSSERQECTPGSFYIIRCKQCICPYVGNINNFCRPLPKNFYCEQAFPGYNFLPMGRRQRANTTVTTATETNSHVQTTKRSHVMVTVKHEKHTIHKCKKHGFLMNECFICECEGGDLIEEHCFKSDSERCNSASPTSLIDNIDSKTCVDFYSIPVAQTP